MTDALMSAIAKLESLVRPPLLDARVLAHEKLAEMQQLVRCGVVEREALFK